MTVSRRSLLHAAAGAATVVRLAWPVPSAGAEPHGAPAPAMPDDEFWELIAQSRSAGADQAGQLAALRALLMLARPARIVAFGTTRVRLMTQAYNWTLWAAADLIGAGAPDDDFEYFRSWLIAQGRGAFERTLADPDGLADWLPDVDGMLPDFEAFGYLDRQTWAAKTGRSEDDYPGPTLDEPGELTGDKPPEDPAWLANHYPKLWRRFGARSVT